MVPRLLTLASQPFPNETPYSPIRTENRLFPIHFLPNKSTDIAPNRIDYTPHATDSRPLTRYDTATSRANRECRAGREIRRTGKYRSARTSKRSFFYGHPHTSSQYAL